MHNSGDIDETLEVVGQVLLRCFLIGVGLLLLWWAALGLMGDLTYSVHSWLTPMTREQFNLIHYCGLLLTKAGISLLFFFPYVALRPTLALVSSGDGMGHGPDTGSDEWKSVIEFKLGVRGNAEVPDRSTGAWCSYIDEHLPREGAKTPS